MMKELYSASLQDGYVPYNWEKKVQETLLVPNSSCFLSILFLPQASDHIDSHHYNNLEDTLSRANAWLHASQTSGVPLVFMNIQTESLLTKVRFQTLIKIPASNLYSSKNILFRVGPSSQTLIVIKSL